MPATDNAGGREFLGGASYQGFGAIYQLITGALPPRLASRPLS
jgi:hypothetical protein